MTYEIPEYRIPVLEKKLAAIEKKCREYGCDYHYSKSESHIKEFNICGRTYRINMVTVDVDASARINGWKYVASIGHYPEGNVIKTMTPDLIPDRYRTSSGYCEHCGTTHNRKYTFLVSNGTELKQVGKSCLQLYTNGLSANMAAQIEAILDLCSEMEDQEFDLDHIPGEAMLINVKTVFNYTWYIIRKYGFSTRNGDRITQMISDETGIDPEFSISDRIIEWYRDREETSLDIHNYKTVAETEYIRQCDYPVALDAVYYYAKELQREERRQRREEEEKKREAEKAEEQARKDEAKAERLKSQFQGKVGDKLTIDVKSCRCVHSGVTQYGMYFLYELADKDGNIYKWFASSAKLKKLTGGFTLIGTVKKFETYQNEKYTVLTRCKVA